MRKRALLPFKLLTCLLFITLLTIGCNKENSGGGGGGDKPTPVEADKANPYGDKVFYEIFVRSFADSDGDGIGDLNGVTAKLDYLKDMGVTGIWLMPINPTTSYHGYDVTDFKEVNPEYGTLADFDNLVAQAKSRGIGIVLDFVINHSSNQHPWFTNAISATDAQYRNYFSIEHKDEVKSRCESGQVAMVDDNVYNSGAWRPISGVGNTTNYRYYGAFDSSMPDFNYGRVPNLNPVYDEILDAARFWMKRGALGLRLDAVKHIYQNERGAENVKFLNRLYSDLKADYPDIYMVGEVLSGMDDTAPFFGGLPSLFHFDSWWKLEGALMSWEAKYYAKDMNEAMYKFRAISPTFNAATKLSNHDEDRAMSKLGGNVEKAKIAAAAIMTSPGQPYIYYGEEVGMSNMKSSGDEYVREPILWGDNYTTTWRANTAPTTTVAAQLADQNSLLNFYKQIVKVRNSTPALQHGVFEPIAWANLPSSMMAWIRSLDLSRVFVVMNGSGSSISHSLNYDLSGAKTLFSYNNPTFSSTGSQTSFTLPAYSILIIEK